MKYVDFKKFTEENGAQSAYLFEGEETYFRDGGVALLLNKFVGDKTLDYTTFEGSAIKNNKSAFVSACASFPFLSERRIVRVREWYPTEKEYETTLKPILENPTPNVTIAVVNALKTKSGAVKLSSKKSFTVVDCGKSDEQTVVKWIYLTLKRGGVAADASSCEKVAEYCVYDMSRISKETEKITAYCLATGAPLTGELVDEIIYPDSAYKIYELSSALSAGNAEKFERISSELFTKGFDETALISSLTSYFKTMYEVSTVSGSDKEIAEKLNLNEYAVKKNRRQAAETGRKKVYGCYEYLFGVLFRIKSGALTPGAAFKEVKAELLLR